MSSDDSVERIAELSSAFAPCDTTEGLALRLWQAICERADLGREIGTLYQIVQQRMEVDGQGIIESAHHPTLRLETYGEWNSAKKRVESVRKPRFDRFDRKGSRQ